MEQRTRRDSDKCIVKLTGAVPLLAEPNCIKHPRCADGGEGVGAGFSRGSVVGCLNWKKHDGYNGYVYIYIH